MQAYGKTIGIKKNENKCFLPSSKEQYSRRQNITKCCQNMYRRLPNSQPVLICYYHQSLSLNIYLLSFVSQKARTTTKNAMQNQTVYDQTVTGFLRFIKLVCFLEDCLFVSSTKFGLPKCQNLFNFNVDCSLSFIAI